MPWPEGHRSGCGATPNTGATQSFRPGVGKLMRQTRPDLPFMGVHGMEGRTQLHRLVICVRGARSGPDGAECRLRERETARDRSRG